MLVQLGTPHLIQFQVKDSRGFIVTNDTPFVTIKDAQTMQYWNGFDFQPDECNIFMTLNPDTETFECIFSANKIGCYIATCQSALYKIKETSVIDIYDTEISNMRVMSNSNIVMPDGTDGTVVNDKGVPLSGVSVIAYDITNSEKAAQTTTDSSGGWSLVLRPGTYQITFNLKGHTTVSLQRVVE